MIEDVWQRALEDAAIRHRESVRRDRLQERYPVPDGIPEGIWWDAVEVVEAMTCVPTDLELIAGVLT